MRPATPMTPASAGATGLRPIGPIASLYASWALTGFWPITAKIAGEAVDPILFGFLHLALGLASLLPWLLARGRWRRLAEPGLVVPFLVLGGLGSGITTAMLQIGVGMTTAANAAIVCQVEVVYSAILAALILGERISPRQAAASTLVLAGTAVILGKDLGTPHWAGDLLILATPWMFQVSHIYSKRLPEDIEPVTIVGARLFYGMLVLGALLLLRGALGPLRWSPTPRFWPILAFHGILLNSIGMTLWYGALRKLELAKTTAVMLSYPALTLVYCWLLGQEGIGPAQVAGLALSMTGAIWLTLQMQAPRPAAAGAAVPATS